jgi:mono/diheme cytochrome c family protein
MEDIYHILYTGRLQGRKQVVGDVLLPPWVRTVEDIYHILYTGRLQGRKQAVGDVLLPPWANSVDDFIRQHRNALGKASNLR